MDKYLYRYFPEDISYRVLFREMAPINYWNLIEIVSAVVEKLAILPWVPCKGPPFLGDTDLQRANRKIPNMNQIRSTAQALDREAHIHPSINTYIHTHTNRRHYKNHSCVSTGTQNVQIHHNLKLDFFYDHKAFSCILRIWESKNNSNPHGARIQDLLTDWSSVVTWLWLDFD
jgi:hypothetical protein